MIDLQTLPPGHFQLARIETEQVQDGGMNVCDVMPRFDGVETEFIGRAVDKAALEAGASEPDGEAVWVVIAAVLAAGALFKAWRAAELGAENDHDFVP